MGSVKKLILAIYFFVRRNITHRQPKSVIYDYSKSNLGKNVRISAEVYFDVINPQLITIEDHCVIGMRTSLLTHGPISGGQPIVIRDHVWLGYNVLVLPGCEIGPSSIVGAGSVVTKSFPEGHCIIAGNPAKKIRDLSKIEIDDMRYHLENVIPIGKV